jgi:DNA-binding HxlR family transcriptional regulator
LIARLNPGHPRQLTLRALAQLHEAGLVAKHPRPLTPLLPTYALTPAGRRWVRHHG